MATTKTLGGDRLGAGKKMTVTLPGYGRSSHNVGKIFTTDQAVGTLVPYYCDIGLNGDTFYIDMETNVRTLPTNGPIFGSFKHQIDWFVIPIRLYIAALHNNALGIGLKMDKIFMPKLKWTVKAAEGKTFQNNDLISQDSLMAYLGLRGLGQITSTNTNVYSNALFLLAYWDIYKNYYANKQEEIGYYITPSFGMWTSMEIIDNGTVISRCYPSTNQWTAQVPVGGTSNNYLSISFGEKVSESYVRSLSIQFDDQTGLKNWQTWNWTLTALDPDRNGNARYWKCECETQVTAEGGKKVVRNYAKGAIKLQKFNLEDIDSMREDILKANPSYAFQIVNGSPYSPYAEIVSTETLNDGSTVPYARYTMAGLGLKTYLSDRFNNWLSTEWIDGEGGINEITAVDVSDGKLTMDALILQKKVFDLLNRIAVSGGSYNDWQEAVYGMKTVRMAESPMYVGGMASEIVFDEVVSNSAAEDEPLGTLAGRGIERNKRGGRGIKIKITEPSMIMCIGSITPRVTYSQGNKWWTLLETMNDFHKPELDAIGFQELVTDEFAAFSTKVATDGTRTFTSVGKQPSWMEYMTNVNESFGDFSANEALEWMVLNRKYEMDEETGAVMDATTYIDPTIYNIPFADASMSGKNFWVNVAFDITARRVMSAKQIPNL